MDNHVQETLVIPKVALAGERLNSFLSQQPLQKAAVKQTNNSNFPREENFIIPAPPLSVGDADNAKSRLWL